MIGQSWPRLVRIGAAFVAWMGALYLLDAGVLLSIWSLLRAGKTTAPMALAAVHGLTLAGVTFAIVARRRVVAVASALWCSGTLLIEESVRGIYGQRMSTGIAQTLYTEAGQVEAALTQYAGPIAVACFAATCAATLLLLARGLLWPRVSSLGFLLLFAGVGGAFFTAKATAGSLSAFSPPVKVPALALYLRSHKLYDGPRAPPQLTPDHSEPRARLVVLVLDESIRADAIQLSAPELPDAADATPKLRARRNKIADLGAAVAASNCSSSTNLVLRTGLRLNDLPDGQQSGLRQATIFQHAKQAGYSTHFLDGQLCAPTLDNFMNPEETRAVDNFFRACDVLGVADHRSDQVLSQELLRIAAAGEPSFVFIKKFGVHFPHAKSHPPEFKPLGTGTAAADYLNGVRWSVDGVMPAIFDALDPTTTALIYTSDHGETVSDSAAPSHCVARDPPMEQGLVPLLVFGEALTRRLPSREAEPIPRPRSHFQVFPTLLVALGYPEQPVEERFGPALWRQPAQPPAFISGDALGRASMQTNAIDAAKIGQAHAASVASDGTDEER